MSNLKKALIAGLITIAVLLLVHHLRLFDPFFQIVYDIVSGQEEVNTESQLDSVISSISHVSYDEIKNNDWATINKINTKKYKNIYKRKDFSVIRWFDRYKYIAGKFRIKDLVTKEKLVFGRLSISDMDENQYTILDKKVLMKTIQLIKYCKKNNLNYQAIKITSAFRPPTYNERVGGVSNSRHIFGDAIDFYIGDINNDEKHNQKDVEIIFNVLDKNIIRNSGGLGKYKGHPFLIHIDMRGSKPNGKGARW